MLYQSPMAIMRNKYITSLAMAISDQASGSAALGDSLSTAKQNTNTFAI
jgi:hypothetical protein